MNTFFQKSDEIVDDIDREVSFRASNGRSLSDFFLSTLKLHSLNGQGHMLVKLHLHTDIGGWRRNVQIMKLPYIKVALADGVVGNFHFFDLKGKSNFSKQIFSEFVPDSVGKTYSLPKAIVASTSAEAEPLGTISLERSNSNHPTTLQAYKLQEYFRFRIRDNFYPSMIPVALENGIIGFIEVDYELLTSLKAKSFFIDTPDNDSELEKLLNWIKFNP